MRVLVATDAWHPQVNGVVRTYERLAVEAPSLASRSIFLAPPPFRTLPCPTYPEIRLVACVTPRAIARHIDEAKPDFIHIATEGPIGLMTRRYCRKTQMAVHHELSHSLPRICLGAAADAGSTGATRCNAASTTAPPAPSSPLNRSQTSSPRAASSG